MPTQISKSQFKAHALEIFRQIETTGAPVVITDRGAPSLEVRRYTSTSPSPLARLQGTLSRYERPTDPVDDDAWNAAL